MSRSSTRSFTRLAIAIIAAAIVISAAALSYSAVGSTVTKTSISMSTFTTTLQTMITVTSTVNHTTTLSVYAGPALVGNCTVTNYFVPDTIQASYSVITVTSGSSTFSYTTYSYGGVTTQVQTGKGYQTTIYTNTTGTFTLVGTSTGDYDPSSGWTVTACTFVD